MKALRVGEGYDKLNVFQEYATEYLSSAWLTQLSALYNIHLSLIRDEERTLGRHILLIMRETFFFLYTPTSLSINTNNMY